MFDWVAQRRRLVVGLAITSLIAACATQPDTTTDFAVGDPSGEYNGSFSPGVVLWAGTSGFSLRPGSSAELVSVEVLGLPSDVPYRAMVSSISAAGGELGLFPESAVPPQIQSASRPLSQATITPGDGDVQVIVRFTLPAAGVAIHGYRLSYRRDGATRTLFIPYSDHACSTSQSAACAYIEPRP